MADEDKDDRTEQASQRRLRQAFDEGQVPLGRDLCTAAAFAAGVCVLIVVAASLRESLLRMFVETFRTMADRNAQLINSRLIHPLSIGLAVCAAASLVGAAVTIIQTQAGIWPHLATPDFTRVFQGTRLARLASKEFLADLGISTVKAMALAAVLWRALGDDFLTLSKLLRTAPEAQLAATFTTFSRASGQVLLFLLIFAGVDLAITRSRFMARMKMTREEAKREFREEEGDPLLRSRRRRRYREILKGHAAVDVPRADALVVNPTHVAVAIRYRKDEGKAPRVTCKGKGKLAEVMREIARENSVPIVQDIALARLLYRRVKVGKEVPAETYRAVAAILAFVYRVTGRNPGVSA